MTARLIDGRSYANALIERIKIANGNFEKKIARPPGLAVVLVGQDPASQVYVGAKKRKAAECGFYSRQIDLPETITQCALEHVIEELNRAPTIDGILLQLPLPPPLRSDTVIQLIAPDKDVDGLTFVNAGKLASGALGDALLPCTPMGAMALITQIHGSDLSRLEALVIGRSNLFGKPMGQLLLNANATVTMAHSKSPDLSNLAQRADVVIAAVGKANLVRGFWIKPGATIIDVGINRQRELNGKSSLVGDVNFVECIEKAGAITPVPGGVGPMTIAMLMANTLIAAHRRNHLPDPSSETFIG